ncbi:MAG: hypothetical protein HRU09_08155 [Oligoflexales bacterium]|nr:hypothetical protein [Oligoflexales bacterium]
MDKNSSSKHKKSLSVIYFVDAKKTRSFSLSLTKVNLILALFFALVFWSGLSIYFVSHSVEEKNILKDRLHASLATIFEYQSRYDGVYELAYPRVIKKAVSTIVEAVEEESGKPDDQKQVAKKENEKSKAKVNDSKVAEEKEEEKFDPSNIVLSIEKVEAKADSDWPVIVEDISYQKEQDDFELNFAIRNTQSPERAEGYIWSVVTLLNKKGEKSYIGSPSGVKVDDKGKIINPPKGANWYSIRYYKAKSFYFQIPEQRQFDIKEIKISMMNLEGQKSVYHLPVRRTLVKEAQNSSSRRNPMKITR